MNFLFLPLYLYICFLKWVTWLVLRKEMIRNEGNETDLLRFDILTHMYVIKLLLYFDTHILPLTEIEKKKKYIQTHCLFNKFN